jgi:hypothetical protein
MSLILKTNYFKNYRVNKIKLLKSILSVEIIFKSKMLLYRQYFYNKIIKTHILQVWNIINIF